MTWFSILLIVMMSVALIVFAAIKYQECHKINHNFSLPNPFLLPQRMQQLRT